jgi:ABC-type phosphate/phosphonate transport system substrate-binding protein
MVQVIYTGATTPRTRRCSPAGPGRRRRAAERTLDPADRDRLRVLAKTAEVAPQPFAIHPHVYKNWVTAIQRALLRLSWVPEGRDILKSMQFTEIVVSNDIDYDMHRELASRLGMRF